MDVSPVRVRFAPSPTGRMHIGNARSALYPFLLARRSGGTFILRIEDTDQKRYDPHAERELIAGLRWLGLEYDEGPDIGGPNHPYRQTERREHYHAYAWKLADLGRAFPCFCSQERLNEVRQAQMAARKNPRYDGLCRSLPLNEARRRAQAGEPYVIRFKMPKEGSITAIDLLRGPIITENSALDDSVLLKSDGLPTYHLAAMLDDHLMGITHVIRGSEWLPSMPLHMHIIRAFGWKEPQFVHLSVFLKPSGKGKLSKRDSAEALKDGHSIFIGDMKDLGYTPEGVLNWISLMGWGVAEDDILTLDEMIARFSLENLTPSPAAINFAKLDHFNATHIRRFTSEDLAARVRPFLEKAGYSVDAEKLLKIIPLIRERLVTLDDSIQFAGFFFLTDISPAPQNLTPQGLTPAQAAEIARKALRLLTCLPELSHHSAEPLLRQFIEETGLKPNQVFGILRVAITGQTVSPPLFESMEIIGRETVLARLRRAVEILASFTPSSP